MKDFWQKLAKVLLFLFLILIPTQLGRHFWPEWSYVLGIRIDYLSPTLYLVDLIWIGLFLVESRNLKVEIKNWFNWKRILILVFVVVNIFLAANKSVAIYGWIRIFQIGWSIWFFRKNNEKVKTFLKLIIPWWILIEGILAVGQISKGGSLGGWWWWLGERSFDFNTIGIAQMSFLGNGLVRAYGTFSHPNSLAGFVLIAWIWWWKYKEKKVFWWIIFWLSLLIIILTGSRTVWFLSGVSLFFFLRKNYLKNKNWIKVLALLLGLLIVAFKIIDFNYPFKNFLGGWDENGLIKRGQLNLMALEMTRESPVVGVGIKNFLVKLPDFQRDNYIFWLQPVHNIFLLVLSEVGIVGLLILIYFLKNLFKKRQIDWIGWLMIGVVLVSGMVDHYWLTLPQNMWLLVLILGLI